ncbi:cell division protein ZapE [Lutibaculum baratangense]|uniref:ATPase n=1 Tax=Lutibaculum baratangense AMV1 TaxID=631454 RepID=V4RLE7_9HYPH|nr:cell division protein ZapE [Lutibaculum baratangense]ESR24060.1 ATPase [Lutibaculum baratangense AMV1]
MSDVRSRYDARVAAGDIEHDTIQADLADRLDRLADQLADKRLATKSSSLGWLFARKAPPTPKGLYIWGGVGRGKTMLVDLFFGAVPVRRKRRTHFADFMGDVHERVHEMRKRLKAGEVKGDDPIRPVANIIAEETRLLCLDEFHVDDIADAMVLGRLFTALFERGLVLVATSNTEPSELYRNGLNRQLFLPFLELLQQNVEVYHLDAPTDYRVLEREEANVWFAPADDQARKALDHAWCNLTGTRRGTPTEIRAKGRVLHVPEAAAGAARFSFRDLCEKPLSSGDYLRIARRFHTVFLDDIPVLPPEKRNEARRFVLLIDTLYDEATRLLASAEAPPPELHPEGQIAPEFQRTSSRLIEMGTSAYLERAHERRHSKNTSSVVDHIPDASLERGAYSG